MEFTDEELMLQVAKHDREEALVELIERYRTPLVNHFLRRGVHHEYEDLAQDTFVRLYKARKRYKVRAKFRTYLYHIAHRVWQDHLRKSARRQRRETAFRHEPRPQYAAPDTQSASDLDWALSHLAALHREVLVYAAIDHLSHAEISEILGIPTGTVKSRLHHAMTQLRTLLSKESP